MNELNFDGVRITVERKPIKNLYLRVHPSDGRIVLSAPKYMPDALIRQFAEQRLLWMKKHLAQAVPLSAPHYESGETLPLWGEPYVLEVVSCDRKRMRVECIGQSLRLHTPNDSTEQARRTAINNWYRAKLKEAVLQVLPGYEQVVGKRAAEFHIRDMTSRWGTCNTKSAVITLNLQLVKRPPECLDYVIVHELTHLYEPGHNARFYGYMDRFYPNWKQVRKQLKQSL